MEDLYLSLSEDLKGFVFDRMTDELGRIPTKEDVHNLRTIITEHIVGGHSHPGDELLIDYDDELQSEFEYELAEKLLSELRSKLDRKPTEEEYCSFVHILETVLSSEASH